MAFASAIWGPSRALSAIRIVLTHYRPISSSTVWGSHRYLASATGGDVSTSAQADGATQPARTAHVGEIDLGPDPLNPHIPTSPLGLPLQPLPPPIPTIQPVHISREALHRLHRLSALDPPAPDSKEETELISELGELVGLMEIVKGVELDLGNDGKGYSELLGRGVGEVMLNFDDDESMPTANARNEASSVGEEEDGAKQGRELLEYATRRVGDYYASRIAPRPK